MERQRTAKGLWQNALPCKPARKRRGFGRLYSLANVYPPAISARKFASLRQKRHFRKGLWQNAKHFATAPLLTLLGFHLVDSLRNLFDTGAPSVAPEEPSSLSTTIAYSGSSAGKYPANQVCRISRAPRHTNRSARSLFCPPLCLPLALHVSRSLFYRLIKNRWIVCAVDTLIACRGG